jgi:hypothetical protein
MRCVKLDELMRTVNFYGAAQNAWTSLDNTTRSGVLSLRFCRITCLLACLHPTLVCLWCVESALEAYCAGVNSYLDTNPPIPIEVINHTKKSPFDIHLTRLVFSCP